MRARRAQAAAAALVVGVIEIGTLGACSREAAPRARAAEPAPPIAVPAAAAPRDIATLDVRGYGSIRIELLPDVAPATVQNFITLAESGFYTGTTFHRVIPDFAIQGGDPNSRDRDPRNDGRGGPEHTLPDEFSDISHVRGIVAMANKSRPKSAGSQFFIVVQPARPLDGKYTVFGHVVDGMDIVDRISLVERDRYGRHGPPDRPMADVVIERVTIERGAGGSAVARSSGEASATAAAQPGGGVPQAALSPDPAEATTPPAASVRERPPAARDPNAE